MAKSNLVEDVSQSGCTLLRYCICVLVTTFEFQGLTDEVRAVGLVGSIMAKSNLVEDVSQSGCTLLRYCICVLVTTFEFQGLTDEVRAVGLVVAVNT